VKQSHLWVGNLPLYDWQVDTLNAAQQPHSRALLSTNNESGKSSVLAVVFLFGIASTFRGAACHATSGNEEQLRGQLFSLLKQQAEQYGWKVHDGQMLITLPNESTIRCSVKQDARSAEGFHGYMDPRGFYRPCAYFIDEAKHVQNATEEAVRRIDPDFYLACSTPPTEQHTDYNWFWKGIDYDSLDRVTADRRKQLGIKKTKEVRTKTHAQLEDLDPIHSFPGEYFSYRRIVTWEETPHLLTPSKKLERDNIIKRYGKDSAFVRSMLFGLATDGDVECPIFNEEEVTLMRKAMAGEYTTLNGDTRAAADVSGTGESDPMVIGLRNGTEVLYLQEHKGLDDIAQAEYLVKFCKDLKLEPWQLCIDGMGIGASVANRMEQTLNFPGLNRFLANNKPTFNFQFADRYTELHWTLKDLLSYSVLKVPWCQELLRDMRQRQYYMMPTGKIKTEPKPKHRKRTGHSPDFLDLMIYLIADIQISRIRRGQGLERPKETKHTGDQPWQDPHGHGANSRNHIMQGLQPQESLYKLISSENARKH